jgi:hypothetical protein
MWKGRARWALRLGSLVLLVAVALADTPASGHPKPFKYPPGVGRIRTDGTFTPGQLEVVRVRHFPPGRAFGMSLAPAPGINECFSGVFFCTTDALLPAPGAPAFRTSKKGIGVARFVVPSEYQRESYPGQPPSSAAFSFQNGDGVLVEASAWVPLPHSHHTVPTSARAGKAMIWAPAAP